ncbi:MAG: A24 family peptidase [Clostridiaceae bacterium]
MDTLAFAVLPGWVLSLFAGLFGLLFGSFTNVLIYRMPRGEEFVKTPSHCTACGHKLSWYELIPVVSYAALGGRCKSCKAKISAIYPMIECVSALLWVLCALRFGLSAELLAGFCLSTALLAVSVIDWRTQEIPDGFQIFLLAVGVLYNVYAALAGRGVLVQNIVGFFAASVPLYLIGLISRGGMGGGDVKLMAVCGLLLGWQRVLLTVGIAAVLGTLVMLPIHIIKRKERKEPIPFGPFLAAGAWVAFLYGGDIFRLWLGI